MCVTIMFVYKEVLELSHPDTYVNNYISNRSVMKKFYEITQLLLLFWWQQRVKIIQHMSLWIIWQFHLILFFFPLKSVQKYTSQGLKYRWFFFMSNILFLYRCHVRTCTDMLQLLHIHYISIDHWKKVLYRPVFLNGIVIIIIMCRTYELHRYYY